MYTPLSSLVHGSCCATKGYKKFHPVVSTNPTSNMSFNHLQNLSWNFLAQTSCFLLISSAGSVSVGSRTMTGFLSVSRMYNDQQSMKVTRNMNFLNNSVSHQFLVHHHLDVSQPTSLSGLQSSPTKQGSENTFQLASQPRYIFIFFALNMRCMHLWAVIVNSPPRVSSSFRSWHDATVASG